MREFFKQGLIILMLLHATQLLIAQSRQDLERQKSAIKKELDFKSKLLKETQTSKKSSLSQLTLLQKQIAQREQLLITMQQEIDNLANKIDETESIIEALQTDLEELKEEYAVMVFYAYKNRSSYDKLMFIFASESFNQAYKRLKYLQQYSQFRKRQADAIVLTQNELERKKLELEARRVEKELLLSAQRSENNKLAGEKESKSKLVAQLNNKEKELKREIDKKEKEAKALTLAIEKAIAEEIKRQKEAEKKSGVFGLTPEAKALSANFENNRSNLPWPVQKGVITESFGEHPHPVLKGIKINNNGINIATNKGASARAVFDGEVSAVFVIPGAGKAILVRHGEFLTVYSQLQEVYVQKGDKVSTKQNLGLVLTDPETGETEMHFEVWKGKSTLDPALWIYSAR